MTVVLKFTFGSRSMVEHLVRILRQFSIKVFISRNINKLCFIDQWVTDPNGGTWGI